MRIKIYLKNQSLKITNIILPLPYYSIVAVKWFIYIIHLAKFVIISFNHEYLTKNVIITKNKTPAHQLKISKKKLSSTFSNNILLYVASQSVQLIVERCFVDMGLTYIWREK